MFTEIKPLKTYDFTYERIIIKQMITTESSNKGWIKILDSSHTK